MNDWHVDAGLAVLIKQMKSRYPKLVVGTIGDKAHQNRKSDHNPEADGSVDAADFMLNKTGFDQSEAERFATTLALHSDHRLSYVIWDRGIWKPGIGWEEYNGSNPHTGHVHVSVNDKHHSDLSSWNLTPWIRKLAYMDLTAHMPLLRQGDRDDQLPGYNLIARLQLLKGVEPDGIWGPVTSRALGFTAITSEQQWRDLLGMERTPPA